MALFLEVGCSSVSTDLLNIYAFHLPTHFPTPASPAWDPTMPSIQFTISFPTPWPIVNCLHFCCYSFLPATMIHTMQVGPKTPTPILAAPPTVNTEMLRSGQTSSNSNQHASKDVAGMAELVAGPSIAVDMESSDVRAERDRVASMISLENECIVIKDLRKVYPPQVGPCVRMSVLFGPAHMQGVMQSQHCCPASSPNIRYLAPPLAVSSRMVKYSCYRQSIHFAVLHGKRSWVEAFRKFENYDMQHQ